MSAPEHDELDALTRDYVAAFVAVEQPSEVSARASWRAIDRKTSRRSAIPIAAIMLVAAAVLLLVLVDWNDVAAPDREDTPSQAPYENAASGGEEAPLVRKEQPRPPRVTPPPAPPSAGDAGAVVVEPVTQPHERPRRAIKRDNAQPAPPGPSALAEETRLLASIQEALTAGRPNDALGKVAAYRKRFPLGMFSQEVTVAKAEALCGVGQIDQARGVIEAFVKRHPTSHLVARAKRICAP